jgi:hypothetical protein
MPTAKCARIPVSASPIGFHSNHVEEFRSSGRVYGNPSISSRMGGTTLVSFRSVPTAELNYKLTKHSGDADGSSSTLCFVHYTRTEAEVEKDFCIA